MEALTRAHPCSASQVRSSAGPAASQAAAAATMFWAGAAVSGNLIAAPAKFQAPSLSLPVALEVGRMQFLWIGVAEAICLLAILLLLTAARRWPSWPLLAATAVFALQRLWLLPLLDIRTLAVIAGTQVEESSLHIVYVAAEILKTVCLVWAGTLSLRFLQPQTRQKPASKSDQPLKPKGIPQ
ncbi:hypothetical protein PhaeoP75_01177 [Phaeobacter gallaeciensis]|uniref:Uncharacterized protein n=2 Tax=Phaeobacter gallaeciensis TaxID=60890 RepID=A0AAC9Z6M1_9RHOB|nr:hypothetical protein [Phaeobacter gallaeciensis]AHD08908.1 hypothetical protein Gal_01135 [Phaeobacter gallaeciensis DSM 26640]ATE92174.1 hypothetical protein PhaeoP11_01130 [Phaeobacter gallaeciensis]ATE98007.1 hypothetical protein PhaeoP73_02719 [Phaeobacter gallaeciensis]ATF00836.1 hypothetical protein PhaeoP75_01177 [Phaeobacter gallaeciensis]ATF05216.1 hypothetical protein PhaeoP63_01125 [Phaeobacter gallaeciensis]